MWKCLFSPPWFCSMQVDSKIKFPTSSYINKCYTWLTRGIHRVNIYNMYKLANFPLHYLCKHYSQFDLFTHVTNRCISTWVSTCSVNICTYSVFGDGMDIQMIYSYHETMMMMILEIAHVWDGGTGDILIEWIPWNHIQGRFSQNFSILLFMLIIKVGKVFEFLISRGIFS